MLKKAKNELRRLKNTKKAVTSRTFFKNRKNDIFLGVSKPLIRKIAKSYQGLSLIDIRQLMASSVHEEQALANAILCLQFDEANENVQENIFNFYLKNKKYIRDWDGVDDSAPYIVGKYLLHKDKGLLYSLATSNHLWSRRIAIVSTWWFIRNNQFEDTLKIAKILLCDDEDLIHKATGWMLRELGKREPKLLIKFLDQFYRQMPRTMLRYSIERLSEAKRKYYMKK